MSFSNQQQSIRSKRNSVFRRGGRRSIGFTALVGLLVAVTAYFALAHNGVSGDFAPVCNIIEHTHTECCFAEPELICDIDESEAYMHSDDCFDDEMELICDLEETLGHTHCEECYYTEMDLICVWEEEDDADECEHGEECFRPALLCELIEHIHGIDCCPESEDEDEDGDARLHMTFPTLTITEGEVEEDEEALEEELEDADEEEIDEEEADEEEADEEDPDENQDEDESSASRDPSEEDEDADDEDETEIEDQETPTTETPDEDDLDEEEEIEEEEIEELIMFANDVSTPTSISEPYEREAHVATFEMPITKIVRGEGAEAAIIGMGDDEGFEFTVNKGRGVTVHANGVIELIPFDVDMSEVVVISQPGRITREELLKAIDLKTVDNHGVVRGTDRFKYNNEGVYETWFDVVFFEYGTYYFEIIEEHGTAGPHWIYSEERYFIRVRVVDKEFSNGTRIDGYVEVTDAITGELLMINGMRTTSYHTRTPDPYIWVPPNPRYVYRVLSTNRLTLWEAGPTPQHVRVQMFWARVGRDNSETQYTAICADIYVAGPPAPDDPFSQFEPRGWPLDRIVNRGGIEGHRESALAAALFDDSILDINELNILFGFDGKDERPFPITTDEQRRIILAYVIWFYETKYICLDIVHPNDTFPPVISDPDGPFWQVDPPIPGDNWAGNPTWSSWTVYPTYLMYLGEDTLVPVALNFLLHFNERSRGLGAHILEALITIDRMAKAYERVNTAGESITSLILRDNNDSTITVGYSGHYTPRVSHLVLTWDSDEGVDVILTRYDGGEPFNNGDLIEGEVRLRVDIVGRGSVTFQLSDSKNYFLTGDSIRGALFYPRAIESHEADEKTTTFYQRLVTGIAEFVKLSATMTFSDNRMEFVNYFTTIELPRTVGLGFGNYLISGALLMLASGAALFAHGVKPERQGILNRSKTRFVYHAGKQKRRSRRSGMKRE